MEIFLIIIHFRHLTVNDSTITISDCGLQNVDFIEKLHHSK